MIFVDSNIWIFANIEAYPENSAARKILRQRQREKFATNAIVISEAFHKLSILLNRDEAVSRVGRLLKWRYVIYCPLEQATVEKALHLAKDRKINDAIIAQHARELKCHMLTDDKKDFEGIPGLKVMPFR